MCGFSFVYLLQANEVPHSELQNMCSRVWFITDRRISQEYPQVQILRALKERCAEDDVEFRYLLMDEIVLTITDGQLGKNRTHTCNVHTQSFCTSTEIVFVFKLLSWLNNWSLWMVSALALSGCNVNVPHRVSVFCVTLR